MIIAATLALALAIVWLRRRRNRAREHAGLVAERPTFHVEPPRRRIGSRKDEML